MILDAIVAHKRGEVAQKREETPLAALEEKAYSCPPCRNFRDALRTGGISLGQVKSPRVLSGTEESQFFEQRVSGWTDGRLD